MTDIIDQHRRPLGVAVLGGPTTVIDIAGLRIVMDPTFDPAGEHEYLIKTAGPAVSAAQLGAVDVVLVSHDEHPDNFDTAGRAFAQTAALLLTHPRSAQRLGRPAHGLEPWQTMDLPGGTGHAVTVQAVPAVHGPADGARNDSGHINCEVTGFVLSSAGFPTVYLSGDNASLDAVRAIRERVGPVDIAVLFAGAARVATKERNRPLTLTGQRAAAAAEVLGAELVIPAHLDSWAHFSEGIDEFVAAFDEAGLAHLVADVPHGQWIVPDSAAV
ncbi:MAG: MBL fold metallo-hydrolase [Mycolicibacterium cosmeticum]|nr:MBL fold metallo-hydrolase [Mycolicibacterium cosmeticum]